MFALNLIIKTKEKICFYYTVYYSAYMISIKSNNGGLGEIHQIFETRLFTREHISINKYLKKMDMQLHACVLHL